MGPRPAGGSLRATGSGTNRAGRATGTALLGLTAILLLASGCSSGSPGGLAAVRPSSSGTGTASTGPSATATRSRTSAATPLVYAPLLGGPGATAATADRPALAIAVVAASGLPSVRGLTSADVVFDVAGVGSTARLLALYQSRDASSVGPVAVARPDDVRILQVTAGLLGHAGGQPGVVVQVDRSSIADLGRPGHPEAYTTRTGYPAPYDVFTSTKALYKLAPKSHSAPPSLFAYAGPGRPPALGTARSRLSVRMPDRADETWEYSSAARAWRMTRGPVPGMTATNVVVQVVPYRSAHVGYRSSVTIADVIGDGDVTVAAGRLVGAGTWRKPQPKQLTNYLDPTNTPFRLEPGSTWVVLAPTGSTVRAS